MNFQNLKYFVVVAREMNFTHAAQKLYVSQQALSGHIARLEQECNTALFERSPRLRLTYAGKCLLQHASHILDIERQMQNNLSDIINENAGMLALGISRTRGRVFLPKVLPEYCNNFPNVEIQLRTAISKELESLLVQGDLDLLVGFAPFHHESIQTVHIMEDPLCLIVPKSIFEDTFSNPGKMAELFYQRGAEISAFQDVPFLMMEEGNRVRDMVNRLFIKKGITPKVFLESSDIETLLSLSFKGMGATFAFSSFSPSVLTLPQMNNSIGDAYVFPLGEKEMTGEIVIAYYRNRYLSKAANDFIDTVRQIYRC